MSQSFMADHPGRINDDLSANVFRQSRKRGTTEAQSPRPELYQFKDRDEEAVHKDELAMFLATLPVLDKRKIANYKLGKDDDEREQTEQDMKNWMGAYLDEIDKIEKWYSEKLTEYSNQFLDLKSKFKIKL